MACTRPGARVVLRARFVLDLCWTMKLLGVFTDVRACIPGTGTARSFTKSEYTQSQGDPKGEPYLMLNLIIDGTLPTTPVGC